MSYSRCYKGEAIGKSERLKCRIDDDFRRSVAYLRVERRATEAVIECGPDGACAPRSEVLTIAREGLASERRCPRPEPGD